MVTFKELVQAQLDTMGVPHTRRAEATLWAILELERLTYKHQAHEVVMPSQEPVLCEA